MTVRLHTRNTRLAKAVELAASPADVDSTIEEVDRADVVVTTGELSSAAQRFAAKMGTSLVVVLPEGAEWLQARIAEGRVATLAGPDMATPKPK